MASKNEKEIMIIDEDGFSSVCRALLELEGYRTETLKTFGGRAKRGNTKKVGLIITSYPFCVPLLRELRKFDVPKIILSDNLTYEVISLLKNLTQSSCIVKPIDYGKFRSLVKKILMDNAAANYQTINIF